MKQFDNFEELVNSINKRHYYHKDLELFNQLLIEYDHPQLKLKCIHIGGTNGKGSTTDFLRSILQAEGYKVGTFTSPYLEVHNDRIRINDVFISDNDFILLANKTASTWEKYNLSMFEIDMLVACLYFHRNDVDFALFEVGMGGRLDATNVVDPLLSIITGIGLDHTEYLGNSHVEIAYEKAGIIKKHKPCITAEGRDDCLNIFLNECRLKKSNLYQLQPITNLKVTENGVYFDYRDFVQLHLRSLAIYQSRNAALAVEAALSLRSLKYTISNEAIRDGVESTLWKGRFEKIHDHPKVFIDGAHNEQGIQALVDAAKIFPNVKILFSALRDKNTEAMLKMLFTLTNDVTICEFDYYRALDSENLAQGFPVKIIRNYQQAIENCLLSDSVVIITGSLYFVSIVRKYFKKKGAFTQ